MIHVMRDFHPLSSTFIHIHPLSSTFIHFHLLSSTFIHVLPRSFTSSISSTFIRFHPFSSTFIHFHPLSSTFIHFIHFYPVSSSFIHFHPFSSTFINFHPLSPTFIHVHRLSSGISERLSAIEQTWLGVGFLTENIEYFQFPPTKLFFFPVGLSFFLSFSSRLFLINDGDAKIRIFILVAFSSLYCPSFPAYK